MGDFEVLDGTLHAYKGDEKNVVIPNGVTTIGFFASMHLNSVESIHLPATFKELGSPISSPYLENITVDEKNPYMTSVDGVLYSRDKSEILRYPTKCENDTVEIPNGIEVIGKYSFYRCANLKKIVLPSTVRVIELSAFTGCVSLEEICLNEGLLEIGQMAFGACSLKSINLPRSLKKIGSDAFISCSSLKQISIPRRVQELGKSSFAFCIRLERVEIENEKTDIGVNTFKGCAGIKEISIPNIENKGASWFRERFPREAYYTYGIEHLDKESSLFKYLSKSKKPTIEKLVDMGSVYLVKPLLDKSGKMRLLDLDDLMSFSKKFDNVELNCILLDYKSRNYTKEEIEDFENDRLEKSLGMKERTISEWSKIFSLSTGEERATIKKYLGNEDLVEVPEKIGKYVTEKIGNGAFLEKDLSRIDLPKTIKEIGAGAFSHCKNLTEIELPTGIKVIEASLFEGCESLEKIKIPNGATRIEDWAFFGCTELKEIEIPPSVMRIEDLTFTNCLGLTIKAQKGSYAYDYATRMGIKTEEI